MAGWSKRSLLGFAPSPSLGPVLRGDLCTGVTRLSRPCGKLYRGTGNPYPEGGTMKRRPRHPLEVTSDRLGDAYGKYYDKLTGHELESIGELRQAFEEIVEGRR